MKEDMKKMALVFASLAIFSTLTAAADSKSSNNKKSDAEIKKLVMHGKHGLALQMKDSESVRFRSILLTQALNSVAQKFTLCGLFNAKNSYGGYVEEELFFVEMQADGSVNKVWLGNYGDVKQLNDEGDIAYIDRNLAYKKGQLSEYGRRCHQDEGEVKTIWRENKKL